MSTIDVWSRPMAPVNPITEWGGSYRVIAMDQRNAGGRSTAPIKATDGWEEYASDHIAILDHLGIEKCHLMGQCIGGPFIFSMLKAQPERFVCAVIAQPIGRVGEMPAEWSPNFKSWVEMVKDRPDVNDEVLQSFYDNLYAAGFAYSADRDFVRGCQTPSLVLAGNDAAHPFAIAEAIAELMPNAEFIPEWKEGAPLETARARMRAFLDEHTPVLV
jgi:pimeloyl-ACP methyl ester carboxylesterase